MTLSLQNKKVMEMSPILRWSSVASAFGAMYRDQQLLASEIFLENVWSRYTPPGTFGATRPTGTTPTPLVECGARLKSLKPPREACGGVFHETPAPGTAPGARSRSP